jgi:purine-cytosine permease-like protein
MSVYVGLAIYGVMMILVAYFGIYKLLKSTFDDFKKK